MTIHGPKLCRGQLLVTRTCWNGWYALRQQADSFMPTHQEMSMKVHQQRKSYLTSTSEHIPTYSLYRACNAITTPSHCTWKDQPPNKGRWSIANRLPPSLHPKNHFHYLKDKQEVFGCLIQCCIPWQAPSQICSCMAYKLLMWRVPANTRTSNKSMPTYERHKNVLYDISPNIYPSDILRTEVSMVAPAGFQGESWAFTKTTTTLPCTTNTQTPGDLTMLE